MRMLVKDIITEYSVRNKEGKAYPVYSVTNSQGFCKDYFGKEVASKDKSSYKIVPYGCFAYNPSRINVGSIDWQHCEENVIVSPLYNVFEVNTSIAKQEYLSYYFKSRLVSDFINTFAKGTVRLNVPLSTLGEFPIPVPSLSEQQRIVSELDLLSNIIEKKKAQLKEYDQLAQSIFYDMFGDPVTNEKGWEVTKLNSIYKVTSSKRILQEEWKKEGVPFYKVADIVSLIHSEKVIPSAFISDSTYGNLLQHGQVPSVGDILVTSRGTLGQCYIVKAEDKFYFQDGMITWLSQKEKCIRPIYIKMLFSSDSFLNSIEQMANSSTIAYLSINQLSKKKIPLPPLPLQQSFASKIEAIERQKALIQQSIAEVQMLFDSRMDDWFA